MKLFEHAITIALAAAVLLFVPAAAFADFDALSAKLSGVDTVSAATAIQDAPSGRYTVLINRDKHQNEKVLGDWVTFFSGKDAPLIMEDIDCMAMVGDVAGIEMAKSLQSRLPENQMKVRVVDGVLALSKAEAGLFDVIVMSDEMARALTADTVAASRSVEVVHREG